MSRDLSVLTRWESDWRELRVVVAGLGLSGFAAADTLIELGATVVVVDGTRSEEYLRRAETLKIVGAHDVRLGAEHTQTLPDVVGERPDVLVVSPGWRPTQALLAQAAQENIAIWSEIELAWRVREREGRPTAQWLCITGTNGKTTTVTMTAEILRRAGLRAVACGNVGTPVLDVVRDPIGFDVLAVELSSFQLEFTHSIEPLASVVLNLAEDHVDWHGSFEAYAAAKAKIYERTHVAAIFNAQDQATLAMVEDADVTEGCRAIGFTTGVPGLSMLGVVEDLLVDRAFIEERKTSAAELASLADLGDPAPHHTVANALAAAALTRAVGVPSAAVREGLTQYDRGEHRIQVVAQRDGVTWINDSKATNPHAADASLSAFPHVVWIAGGLAKGVEYDELVKRHAHHLRSVVLIGTDDEALSGALSRHAPDVPVLTTRVGDHGSSEPVDKQLLGAEVMAQAVAAAAAAAQAGDTVLMAPASASMDQFVSYAHRGTAFAEAVLARLGLDAEAEQD
ncbi:UDP-N-acetylmuramoyl-L-alanine--D-glutamate ligase [Galactobacter caseinivorans]|uniref:UDP-N-acetylmuramoylalanine--D-glutamate ligase n=1 Tax=Galactobacter caseinivorans TaxID=2676123 RepID=A0A496PMA3_9MICC|nr:UDP-N-acetylmuramoyl-L-alanine--D-glutamate ligase [Galactobacter caseinivorans]RKW71662.1 UDP-N-acetylmuramoyl-L-alanine--D-glutamate ligase [Galactobacter caseinivorans]